MVDSLITGTPGDDELRGTDGADYIIAGAGTDYVFAGAGADLVLGGSGGDYLCGEDGDDHLFGGDDNDVMEGGSGADIVSGDAGDDWLYGGDGRDSDISFDTLLGGAGNDHLYSENADLIDGGSGDDLAILIRQDAGIAFKVDFSTPDRTQTLADGTVITGVERVEFYGGSGADTIRGGDGSDVLRSGGGADQLWGGGGTDILGGGSGRDRLVGGTGGDIFEFAYGTNRDRIIDFVPGEDRLSLQLAGVTFDQIVAATSRDPGNGLVTIDLSQIGGAPADRIELLTDPAHAFAFTPGDFLLFP